jgi:hypothetical protein
MVRRPLALLLTVGGIACLLTVTLCGIVGVAYASRRTPEHLRWLLDSGCEIPCWRGITPGETRFLDAARILREQPDVRLTEADYSGGYNYMLLKFEVQTPQGLLRGEMTSYENASRVLYLYFYSMNAEGRGWLRLADLIALMGSPVAVMQDSMNGSMVKFHFGKRNFEALNFPWLLYESRGCNRWNARVGLYLGDDPSFKASNEWRGFDGVFDRWCNVP